MKLWLGAILILIAGCAHPRPQAFDQHAVDLHFAPKFAEQIKSKIPIYYADERLAALELPEIHQVQKDLRNLGDPSSVGYMDRFGVVGRRFPTP